MWERFKTWFFGSPRCAWCRIRLASYDSAAYTAAGRLCFDQDVDGDPVHHRCLEEERRIDKLLLDADDERYGFQLKLVHNVPPRPPAPERGRE